MRRPRGNPRPSSVDRRAFLAEVVDPLTYRILEETIAIGREERWPMIAIVVGVEGDRLTEIQRRLSANEIPLIVTPAKSERPELYYEVDGHWNPAGHELVAARVMAELDPLLPR